MDFYTFADYGVFRYIWVPAAAAALCGVYAAAAAKRVFRRFYEAGAARAAAGTGGGYRKTALACGALLLLMFALAGPRWNPRPVAVKQSGRDIVILLDVSKSMMARDVKPNRLVMAKTAIEDFVKNLKGDRVALVAFAGAPKLMCPLTTDYGYLLTVLKDLDVHTIRHGGTLIGDAVFFAMKRVFPRTGKAYRDIILITDGEDHGSFPVKAAEAAYKKMHIRIHVFGLGDDVTGAKVPEYDDEGKFVGYKKYRGKFVYSRLDEKNKSVLRKMAHVSGGSWLYAGTARFDLGELYEKKILTAKRRTFSEKRRMEYSEGYQVFLLAGLCLVVLELFVRETRR